MILFIASRSPNSTLGSPQHSMVNVDGCRRDHSYEDTVKEPEQLFDKELFLWLSFKERNTKANAWEKIAATFGKSGKNN